jgi:hypothetical protein
LTGSWARRGRLLEGPPDRPWAASHAALPAVGAIDGGGFDLYFSPRDSDGRAHVARARVESGDDPGDLELQGVDGEPVLSPGALGAFDDSGVTTSWVTSHAGREHLYYTGWTRGVSVPFYFYVGLAVSDDGGKTFHRASPAPVLERNDVDPLLTASPCVLVEGGTWRMWYVSCVRWAEVDGEPRHWYHVKYAESDDGVRWSRSGVVCIDFKDESEYAIARPCVVRDGSLYRMWFSARGDAYRLGYAESRDGISWERRDADAGIEPSQSGFDSEMLAYPLVFDFNGRRHMLYNGNGYGATGIGHAVLEEDA